ncbi:MAG: hypothetical protein WCP45_16750 [Verrucomicrobiota bacterium]
MKVLSIRVSEKERSLLVQRAKAAGVSSGALVRQLINSTPFTTADELLAEMEHLMNDPGQSELRIRRNP